jgi:methylenetetrahydrofolate reductase (NADPH)
MTASRSERRPSGAWLKPPLRELLARRDRFVVAAELVTTRGLVTRSRAREILLLARELSEHPRIDVLSITDNPGGHAMLAADTLGTDLIHRGQEVIIHLSCKDWNRNALESRGWKLASEGFDNVLALSGDYPVSGYEGTAAPVFDIDSVGLLRMYSDMNEGFGREGLGATDFFLGCVVTNHKRHEREVMPQYFKLRKKVEAGARFVINQIGWDTRKDDELLRWIRREELPVSVLANVYLLSRPAARAFQPIWLMTKRAPASTFLRSLKYCGITSRS